MSPSPSPTRVALITGAAGGLGRALCDEFAGQSWQVMAGCHRASIDHPGPSIHPVSLDVTNREQVVDAVKLAVEQWGRIDLLINNAGVTADQLHWKIDDADWTRVLDVNLKGAFLCAQAVARPMMKQRDGQIINVASFSGRNGATGQANYAAAKAGLFGLTESLARELGSRNIRVNAILPGVLPTPMTAGLGEQRLGELAAANTLGRLNSLAEVARFTVFLATMENVSGQLFQLDSRIGRWT